MLRDFRFGGFRSGPEVELNAISSGASFLRANDEPRPAFMFRASGSKKFVSSMLGNSPLPFFFAKGLSGFPFALSAESFMPVRPTASLKAIAVLPFFQSVHFLVV